MGSSVPNFADMLALSVEQCENIDLVGDFGDRYQAGVMALRMAGLRLSRWGAVMNIQHDPQLTHSNLNGSVGQVRERLQQLLKHFDEANLTSHHDLAGRSRGSGGRLNAPEQKFVDQVKQICLRRQAGNGGNMSATAPSRPVAARELRRMEDFELLMSKVLKSLDGLDKLCPTVSMQMYAKLTARDFEQLSLDKVKTIESIMEMVQIVDPRLAASCESRPQGHTYCSVRIRGHHIANGDWVSETYTNEYKSEGNKYEEIVVENGQLLNGNSYGGPGCFSRPDDASSSS